VFYIPVPVCTVTVYAKPEMPVLQHFAGVGAKQILQPLRVGKFIHNIFVAKS
jgi:hypothetical protein